MPAVWRAGTELIQAGEDFVLAVILDVEGSSPRHIGTRFLIRRDGSIVGTIGGGLFETEVRNRAPLILQNGLSRRAFFSFAGKDAEGNQMICGGRAEVLLEFVSGRDPEAAALFRSISDIYARRADALLFTEAPAEGEGEVRHLLVEQGKASLGGLTDADAVLRAVPERRLLKPAQMLPPLPGSGPVLLEYLRPTGSVYVFGGGHVGKSTARLAAYVDFHVAVLDDREEFASLRNIPEAHQIIVVPSFDRAFEGLDVDEDSYIVIVTRGHAHDKTVLAQALRTSAGYIGMIGSRRKIAVIYEALIREGFTKSDLERVHAPIGAPIGGETPEEIAVSIVAELIQTRHRKITRADA
jgi:xanthine dehydrogenase accessory factor